MWLPDTVINHVAEVSQEPDLSGTRYTLVRRIGRGGMGAVYAAHDRELDREVALKVASGGAGLAERLEREAKIIARLEHPGIVPVHDAGRLSDGRVFYVMKLVRGERLDAWAPRHALRERLRLFQRICEAVAFAHARGVLHRDLKPQNVMVGELGEVLVMDWGLAKRNEPEPAPAATFSGTLAGTVLGTPGYMAPEQERGEAATPASDVYGLGAILQTLVDAPVPPALAAIRDKALAALPADRYVGAAELGDDVGRWLEQQPVLARRETLLERTGRFIARNRVILSLAAAYVLVRVVLFLASR